MIIVISLTFMASLIFTEAEVTSALRNLRFVFLILAIFYGILGVLFGVFYFLIRINDIHSYFYPIAPFDKAYFFKSVLKRPLKEDKKRSKILTKKNYTKMGGNP